MVQALLDQSAGIFGFIFYWLGVILFVSALILLGFTIVTFAEKAERLSAGQMKYKVHNR